MKIKPLRTSLLLLLLLPIVAGSCTGSCAVRSDIIELEDDELIFRSEFYRALVLKSDPETKAEAVFLFKDSLGCSNEFIRRFAAEELASIMYEVSLEASFLNGENEEGELTEGVITFSLDEIEQIRREVSGVWALAFETADSADKEKALSFFFSFNHGDVFPNEARLFVLDEFEKKGIIFSNTELSAINAHHASVRSRNSDALSHFRGFMVNGNWPRTMPDLFLRYPILVSSLGRAFMNTNSGREGLDLFIEWERAPAVRAETENPARYHLIYYAGRVARRLNRNEEALRLFDNALQYAYDGERRDVCIWYIAEQAAEISSETFINRLERTVPLLTRRTYIDDRLERFAHRLVTEGEWGTFVRIYDIIKDSSHVSRARYAWIISLLLEEGMLTPAEVRRAAAAAGVSAVNPEVYKEIAYNTGNHVGTSALYYRMASARALGKPLFEIADDPEPLEQESQALEFLLGFFEFGVSDLVIPYIRAMDRYLSPDEIRAVAQALYNEKMYVQAIRTVTPYIIREGYAPNRQDLELFYPNPYGDITEINADRFGFSPALLFGLIRTESAFQSSVVSHANAVGLAQLIPATAREMAGRIRRQGGFPPEIAEFTDPDTELDLNNPALNVYIGTYYLRYMMSRFDDDIMLALMAYNGGMNRIRRWRTASTLPPSLFMESVPIFETRDYGKRVLGVAEAYDFLYYR